MLQSITIPSDGGFYTFPNTNVFLTGITGFGNPEPKLGQHEYGNQHGGLIASQYYRSRRLGLSGYIIGQDVASFEQERVSFFQAFSFLNAEKLLKFTTFGGKTLQCNVIASGAIIDTQESPVASAFALELIASDPIFYSQDSYTVLGSIATLTGAGFALPFSFPLALSGSLEGAMTLTNQGNARVYPTEIKLLGPGTNFTLSNKTTVKDLFYTGTIADGEYVTIDPKRHTAYENGVDSVYGNISGDWWDLYYGNNVATLTVGSGNTSDTGVEITYRSGYWGI